MSRSLDVKPRRWLLAAAIVGLGVLVLAGCADAPPEPPAATTTEGEASPSSGAGPVMAPAEWEHVHNLTLDGSRLLVGTHEGLWVQSEDQPAQLVSDPPFDVMGLARSGQQMLASGHPGVGQDLPDNLGLQQSTDDGVTWTSVSLEGEVDFHRLGVSGRVLLGLSASDGRLLRSTDAGTTWTDLGTPPLYDLAVNPTDAEMVVGTTEQGPVASDDGGKSFTPLADAPLLALLSWTPSHLYGVTPDGTLHTSTDGGATWDEVGYGARPTGGDRRAGRARGCPG